jgi:hypothetical protein
MQEEICERGLRIFVFPVESAHEMPQQAAHAASQTTAASPPWEGQAENLRFPDVAEASLHDTGCARDVLPR